MPFTDAAKHSSSQSFKIEAVGNKADAIQQMFESVSLGAPENAVGFVLWRVVHRYIREVDRALIECDLTHLQFSTLAMAAWLGKTGDRVTQSEVARLANIHPMQLSQMLKMLESKGMVTRARSKSDVRAKQIGMTSAGIRALRRAMPLVIDVQRRFFGDEGCVGGNLLTTLLRLDEQIHSTKQISQES